MSKARTKARHPKKPANLSTKPRPARAPWIGPLVIGVLLVLIGLFFYVFSDRPRAVAPSTMSALTGTAAQRETAPVTTTGTTLLAESAAARTLPLGPADRCRRHPRFARQLGFNERAILTTSAPSVRGLAMIQPAEGNSPEQIYQDPTWDDAGYLGHMTFDPVGTVYVFPAPRVSLIENPPEQQNTLYRVDTDSAALTPFLMLTAASPPSAANPFGLMGTTYDCDTNSLYAATVAGSTAGAELGKIVRIDLTTAAIVAELQGIDPFGLTICNEPLSEADTVGADTVGADTVGKRLYFGAARVAEVYSIVLNSAGDFVGQPTLEFALPDPSLKPWRLVWDTNGDLIVRAMPFDYNLIATSERVEVPFRFRRDDAGLWHFVQE
jgi:hypothetical protein